MRFVRKDLSNIPAKLTETATLAALEDIAARADKEKIKDTIFKGEYKDATGKSQSAVRDKLNTYYFSKCAYCEMFCKAEIEHYRPKKGVTEDNNHNGYYWLCYEWTNLLPSCRYCNTEGGKGNQFPIRTGNRVVSPSFRNGNLDKTYQNAHIPPLIDELPFLIHPEIDEELATYFSFEINEQDGKQLISIKGTDGLNRGESTIKICNLNRDYVRLDRLQSVYYPLHQVINKMFKLVETGLMDMNNLGNALNLVFSDAETEAEKPTLTHTLLRKFIISHVTHFETHFAPYIEDERQRELVVAAFRKYKNV